MIQLLWQAKQRLFDRYDPGKQAKQSIDYVHDEQLEIQG